MPRSFFLGGLFLLVACSYYDQSLLAPRESIEEPGEEVGGEGGEAGAAGQMVSLGGAGAGGEAGTGGAGGMAGAEALGVQTQMVGCGVKPIGPPKNPPTKKDGVDFYLAVKTLDFGEKEENGSPVYKGYGLDLDGYCSCPDDFFCKGTDPDPSRYCDGPNGRDNAAGALVAAFSKMLEDFNSVTFSKSMVNGDFTILFQVTGYNGEPDDDQVEVAWILGDNLSDTATPQWNGQDVWPVQSKSFEADGISPTIVDKNAYVRGNVLVATLPGGELHGEDISITMTAPVLIGTLIPPDANSNYWRIDDGMLAARWDAKNILALLGRRTDPFTKKPLCTDSQIYTNIKAMVCQFADISLGVQAQPNVPCNALSLAMKLTAVESKIGEHLDVVIPQNLCPPETDPAKDSCDQ